MSIAKCKPLSAKPPVTVDETVRDLSPVQAHRLLQSLRLGQPDRNLTRLNSDHAQDIEHYIAQQIATQSSMIKLLYGAFGTGKSTLTQIITDIAREQSVQCSLKTATHSGQSPINQIHLWSMGTRNWIARVLHEIARAHTEHPTTDSPGIEFDNKLKPEFRAFVAEFDVEPPGETLCSLIRIAAHSDPDSPQLGRLATEYTRALTTWVDSGRKKQLTELNRKVSVHGLIESALTPQYDRHLSHGLFRMHLAFYRAGNLYPLWIIDEFEAYAGLRGAAINDVVDHLRDMVDMISAPSVLSEDSSLLLEPAIQPDIQSQAGGLIISTTNNGLTLIRKYKALHDRVFNERKNPFSTSDPTWHTEDYNPKTWKTATVTQYLLRLMDKASEIDADTAAVYDTLSRFRHDPDVQSVVDNILNDPSAEPRVRIRSLLLDYYDRAKEGDAAFENLTAAHKDATEAAEPIAYPDISEDEIAGFEDKNGPEAYKNLNEYLKKWAPKTEFTNNPEKPKNTSVNDDEFEDDEFEDDEFEDDEFEAELLNDRFAIPDNPYDDDAEEGNRATDSSTQKSNRSQIDRKDPAYPHLKELATIISDAIADQMTDLKKVTVMEPVQMHQLTVNHDFKAAAMMLSIASGLLDHFRPGNPDNAVGRVSNGCAQATIFTSPQSNLKRSAEVTKPKSDTNEADEVDTDAETYSDLGSDDTREPRRKSPGELARHISGLACAMTDPEVIQQEMSELSKSPLLSVDLIKDTEARQQITDLIKSYRTGHLFELKSRPLRSVINNTLVPDERKNLSKPGQLKGALSIQKTKNLIHYLFKNKPREIEDNISSISKIVNLENVGNAVLDNPTLHMAIKEIESELTQNNAEDMSEGIDKDIFVKMSEYIEDLLYTVEVSEPEPWSESDHLLPSWFALHALLGVYSEYFAYGSVALPDMKKRYDLEYAIDCYVGGSLQTILHPLVSRLERLAHIRFPEAVPPNGPTGNYPSHTEWTSVEDDIMDVVGAMKTEGWEFDDVRKTLLKATNVALISALQKFELSKSSDRDRFKSVDALRHTLDNVSKDRIDVPWLFRLQQPERLSDLRQQIYYFAFSLGMAPSPFSVDTLCSELLPNLSPGATISPNRKGIGFLIRSSFMSGRKPKWTQVTNTPLTDFTLEV